MKLLLVEGERRMAHYGISHCKPKPNSRKGKIGVSCHDGKIEFYAVIPQQKYRLSLAQKLCNRPL